MASNQTASGQEPQKDDEIKTQLASIEATMARLTTLIENNKPLDALCPSGAIRRKGFQLMGPEGIKEFDQDERLIMAMYTGATPLTETCRSMRDGAPTRAPIQPSSSCRWCAKICVSWRRRTRPSASKPG